MSGRTSRASTVNVVPLRIGGGTRLKIFEAMAAGRAVVSTSIGAEGLPTENGRHLLLADDPAAFARSVVTLLRESRSAPGDGGRGARASSRTRYDWSVAATHLDDALVETRTAASAAVSSIPFTSITANETSMNVAVFGLGYVGSVSAATFADDGHTVIGVDVNPDEGGHAQRRSEPDRRAGSGRAHRAERRRRPSPGDDERRSRRSTASDVSLVSVSTPSRRNGSLDLTHLDPRVRADRRGAAAPSRRTTWS